MLGMFSAIIHMYTDIGYTLYAQSHTKQNMFYIVCSIAHKAEHVLHCMLNRTQSRTCSTLYAQSHTKQTMFYIVCSIAHKAEHVLHCMLNRTQSRTCSTMYAQSHTKQNMFYNVCSIAHKAEDGVCATRGWLGLVESIKLQVSFAKEPYKRDDILQKRRLIYRAY